MTNVLTLFHRHILHANDNSDKHMGNSMRKVCMSMLKDEIVPVFCDFLCVTELESLRHEHCQ